MSSNASSPSTNTVVTTVRRPACVPSRGSDAGGLSRKCRSASCRSAAGDEGNDDVGGVAVEVLTSTVVDSCGAGVGVAGGELDIAERYAGVECGHDEGGAAACVGGRCRDPLVCRSIGPSGERCVDRGVGCPVGEGSGLGIVHRRRDRWFVPCGARAESSLACFPYRGCGACGDHVRSRGLRCWLRTPRTRAVH